MIPHAPAMIPSMDGHMILEEIVDEFIEIHIAVVICVDLPKQSCDLFIAHRLADLLQHTLEFLLTQLLVMARMLVEQLFHIILGFRTHSFCLLLFFVTCGA